MHYKTQIEPNKQQVSNLGELYALQYPNSYLDFVFFSSFWCFEVLTILSAKGGLDWDRYAHSAPPIPQKSKKSKKNEA